MREEIKILCEKCKTRIKEPSNVKDEPRDYIGGYCHQCRDYVHGILVYTKKINNNLSKERMKVKE